MTNNETPVVELKKAPKVEVQEKRKRSEVLAEHKDLMKKNEELLKEMQEREYDVNFKDKGVFTKLYKFLEKDSPWGHTTAAGLIMLFNNLRMEKEKTKDADWDAIVKLRAVNVTTLWTMLTKMEGNGFYEAKNFVEIMAAIGQSISEAVRTVHSDNQELRNNHEDLQKLDQLLDHGQLIEDCKPKGDAASSNGEEGNA
jgi:hypothetical protein